MLSECNLVDSQLPPEYWDWAAEHGVYVWNRCWRPSIGKTPYEVINNKLPDVSKIKVFGSLVFYYIPKEQARTTKITPRAEPGILVGYAGSGYQIWNPYRRELVVSNHVEIKEGP